MSKYHKRRPSAETRLLEGAGPGSGGRAVPSFLVDVGEHLLCAALGWLWALSVNAAPVLLELAHQGAGLPPPDSHQIFSQTLRNPGDQSLQVRGFLKVKGRVETWLLGPGHLQEVGWSQCCLWG